MKLKYCLLALLGPVLNSCAQNKPVTKPLYVGDTIPHIILTDVINFPVSTIQLDKIKSKAVIPGFLGSYGGSCIASFPYLDLLQHKFKYKQKLVLVNTKCQRIPGKMLVVSVLTFISFSNSKKLNCNEI